MSKKRQLNIELLRIFSMLLIILWHIWVHFPESFQKQSLYTSQLMGYITYFIPFHVNIFILITGYFGVRNCRNALIKNLLLIYFYSLGLGIVAWLLSGHFSYCDIFLPISSKTWWFMTMYIVMLLIAPMIEKFVKDASRKTIYAVAVGALFVDLYLGYFRQTQCLDDKGWGMTNFICMYLLGVWIRKEGKELIERLPWARTTLILCAMCLIAMQYEAIAWVSWKELVAYSSPYCIAMSVLVFLLFIKMPPPSESLRKPILFFSSSAISVYLLTDHPLIITIWSPLFAFVLTSCGNGFIELAFILFSTIVIFVVSCMIDKLRIPVTAYASDMITKILDKKIYDHSKNY